MWSCVWKGRDGRERVFSYTLSGDAEGRVFVDYDFGLSAEEAKALGRVPLLTSIGLPENRCHDRVYGLGKTVHAAQDPAVLALEPPPLHQKVVSAEEKSDVFFYEPDDESRHFTITLPEGLGVGAKWYERLVKVGTDREGQVLHLRNLMFGDFTRPDSPALVKGRFVIDLCKSSAALHKGAPAFNGVDFWGGDAVHVPIPPTRNLMSNGSFEQNLKGWRWGYGGAKTVRAKPGEERYAILDGGVGGGRALRIRPTQHGVLWLASQSVPTLPGRKYTLSWYARSDSPKGAVSVIQCSAGKGGGAQGRYSWRQNCDPKKLENGWKRYSTTFEGDAAGVFVKVDGNDAWVDRIMLEEGGAMTDYVEDPIQARLLTSDPDNDLVPGHPIDARLELTGMSRAAGKMRVTVKNFYSEVLYRRDFTVSAPSVIALDLDSEKLGTGVFVMRLDFAVGKMKWTDYLRFCIAEPLSGKHATARFFCAQPWFKGVDRCVDVARKMREWGFGSLGAQGMGNEYSTDSAISSLCRENDLKLVLHPVLYDLPQLEREKWHNLRAADITEDFLAELENLAYGLAKRCSDDDTLWTFFNEEEKMARRVGFENHFKLVSAAHRGCKRAFDERGLRLRFAPTHGVALYFRGRNYDAIDGYLETAKKHGFMYDAVTIHSYQNIDGSILGPRDAEVETQHLIDRMKFYGYPDETPVMLSECFNMVPWFVREWGATGWGDGCWTGAPSEDMGYREFVQAGAMARLYLLALRFYPKVSLVNTWASKINMAFIDHDLQPFAWLKMVNTLGHILPNPRYYGGARPYPDVRGHVFIQGGKSILAVWTSNNDVERGTRKGSVLKMNLPSDTVFIDLMGNRRSGGREVPLTSAPLFIVSDRRNAKALVDAVKTAETDDPSQAIGVEIRPTVDGAVELDLSNLTSAPQKINIRAGKTGILPASASLTGRVKEPSPVAPMEMYYFTTNYPFLTRPWRMSYFYVPKCGAEPDWSKVPSLPIDNEVRRSPAKPVTMKADFKAAWNEDRLFLRVEVKGDDVVLPREAFGVVERHHLYLIDECLEVYFDAFADARKSSVPGCDDNDSRYDFSSGSVWRRLAVNWQLAQGTASASDEEVARKLEHKWTPTKDGCVYEIAFSARYLAPIELKPGTRASLGLFVHDRDKPTDKGDNGLSNAAERGKVCNQLPHLWPEFILLP